MNSLEIAQPLDATIRRGLTVGAAARCVMQGMVIAVLQSLASETLAQTNDAKLSSTEHARVIAYTKEFAKRFALPEPSIVLEPRGLQAIEIRLQIDQRTPAAYRCKVKAYLDNTLAIAYPKDGMSGSRDAVTQTEHFIFDGNVNNLRWQALGLADRKYFFDQDNFRRNAAIASAEMSFPKKGYWADLVFDVFYREVFPGIAYIRLDSDCGAFADAPVKQDLQLWLKRVGGKDYRYRVSPDPGDFLKFAIPSELIRAASGWAKGADEQNRARFRFDKK